MRNKRSKWVGSSQAHVKEERTIAAVKCLGHQEEQGMNVHSPRELGGEEKIKVERKKPSLPLPRLLEGQKPVLSHGCGALLGVSSCRQGTLLCVPPCCFCLWGGGFHSPNLFALGTGDMSLLGSRDWAVETAWSARSVHVTFLLKTTFSWVWMNQKHMGEILCLVWTVQAQIPQAVLSKRMSGIQRLVTEFQDTLWVEAGGHGVDLTLTSPCSKAYIWISPGEQGVLPVWPFPTPHSFPITGWVCVYIHREHKCPHVFPLSPKDNVL